MTDKKVLTREEALMGLSQQLSRTVNAVSLILGISVYEVLKCALKACEEQEGAPNDRERGVLH